MAEKKNSMSQFIEASIAQFRALDERTTVHSRMLEKLSERTEQHTKVLETLEVDSKRSAEALSEISSNTEHMSGTLRNMHEDNKTLMQALTGKRHVPLSIFTWVVGLLIIMLLLKELRQMAYDLKVSQTGLQLEAHKDPGGKPQKSR